MKKNISINLQGMIFHIEEDGYEQLSQYLAAIKNYFSSYEGHEEITADIEARMAEIFYAKLSPTKQVITRDDVQALMAQMGSVRDFQSIEEEEEPIYAGGAPGAQQAQNQTYTANPGQESTKTTGSKRIYRDESRKVIGGVAAGIANYLEMDPIWIRLILAFLIAIAPFTAGISVAFVVICYLLCWLAFPKNYSLPETSTKKLFRNPDDKKLAGIASGISLYFGTDVAVIRLLFLLAVIVFHAQVIF